MHYPEEVDDDVGQLSLADVDAVEDDESPQEKFYPVDYAITSYGADYPIDGLVKRMEAGAIVIPKFQRNYTWDVYRASRFMESLLLGLPVPAIFLYKESPSNKLLVIDGQQRLKTIQAFYLGKFPHNGKDFRLKGVHERYENCTYATLPADLRIWLDDCLLHAIIIRQDEPKEEVSGHTPSSVYHIFERLNTGGKLLLPQEIRACVYQGSFLDAIKDLNSDPDWRALFGKVSDTMKDQELILRCLAMYYDGKNYRSPMQEFLNQFLDNNRNPPGARLAEFASTFLNTIHTIRSTFGDRALRPRRGVNAALCDALFVGVANWLRIGTKSDRAKLQAAFEQLKSKELFDKAITATTAQTASVSTRLQLATEAFENL